MAGSELRVLYAVWCADVCSPFVAMFVSGG